MFGSVEAHDRVARTLDIKRGPKVSGLPHPTAAFAFDLFGNDGQQESVIRLAGRVLAGTNECGAELLYGRPPRLSGSAFAQGPGETEQQRAVRIVTTLDRTVLSIQGPPGSGKTFVGAWMILELVRAGKTVGVTATSHKVIHNLLQELLRRAAQTGQPVNVGAKPGEDTETPDGITEYFTNEAAHQAISSREVNVFGGTSFMWARAEFTRRRSTSFSSTRQGRCRWPTSLPFLRRRRAWCCSATRSSWSSRRRRAIRKAWASRRWSTSWAATR